MAEFISAIIFVAALDRASVEITLTATREIRMIISLIFVVANAYFAFQSFKAKRWGWFAFSTAAALFCAWPLLDLIR